MNRLIKGYNEFIKKNEEFQDPIFHQEEANLEAEVGTPNDNQPEPGEGDVGQHPEVTNDIAEESGYIGDRAMAKLAETLGVELEGNTLTYEDVKIEYVAEFDGFLVKGAGLGVKKVPVVGGNIEDAVNQVMDLVGTAVISEKKEIKVDKNKEKPSKKAKSKDDENKKIKNLKSFKKKK